eukprot:scaffold22822_cov30-Tisochrysis_lutea.AAC.2
MRTLPRTCATGSIVWTCDACGVPRRSRHMQPRGNARFAFTPRVRPSYRQPKGDRSMAASAGLQAAWRAVATARAAHQDAPSGQSLLA